MSITAESLDGAAHAVQVYSDLSAGVWFCNHYSRPICHKVSCRVVVSELEPGDYMEYDSQ